MTRLLPISSVTGAIGKRLAVFAFAAALLTAGAGCEDTGVDTVDIAGHGEKAIVGGQETGYKSWRGVIGLYYAQGNMGSICTATLVHPQILITAGHCVYLQGQTDALNNPGNLYIFGGANLNTGNVKYYPGPAKIVKHPTWNGNLSASGVDLAIIKLSSPITSVETYGVRSGSAPSVGTKGKIVGYGLLRSNMPSSAGIHRMGDTTVRWVGNGLIEIGNPTGTCQGDSGGPLFTQQNGKWVLTGVTSFGISQTCYADQGGYDVDVVHHRSWIESTVKQLVGADLDGGSTGGDTGGDTGGGDPTNPCDASSMWGCDPVSNDGCGSGDAACDFGIDQQEDTGFYCFEGSTESVGRFCDLDKGPWCAGGLTCIQGTCMKYCCGDSDCKSGEQCAVPDPYWPGVNTKELGVCIPAAGGTGGSGDDPDEGDVDTGEDPTPTDDTGKDDGEDKTDDNSGDNDESKNGDDDEKEQVDEDPSMDQDDESEDGDPSSTGSAAVPLTKHDSSSCAFAPSTRTSVLGLELLLGLLR